MSPEQINIAIAKACGWRTSDCFVCGAPAHVAISPEGDSHWQEASQQQELALLRVIPNYHSDLNAMHEAEKVLTEQQRVEYLNNLADRWPFTGDHFNHGFIAAITATAAQRAEAFLRTLGLWEEKP